MGTLTGIRRGQAGSVRRLGRRERGRVRNSTHVGRWLGGGQDELQVSQKKIHIARFSNMRTRGPAIFQWTAVLSIGKSQDHVCACC